MTQRLALSGARPIPGFTPFLAVPGGAVLGAIVGIEFGTASAVVSVFSSPSLLLSSPEGIVALGMILGGAVGAATGLIVGSLVAVVTALMLLVRARIMVTALVGGFVTTTSTLVIVVGSGVDLLEASPLGIWAGAGATGGLVLILWFMPAKVSARDAASSRAGNS